jgi:TRAP-type C4-dicarboxylate transport system substrate-binding protein
MLAFRAIFILLILAAGLPAHGKDFRSSDVNPAGTPTVQGIERLDQLLRDRTQGRHRIAVIGSNDKESENFIISQVRTGTLDMARVSLAAFNASVPSTVPLSLPFLFKSSAHLRRVLDGPIGAEILTSLEDQDIIGLCFYDVGAQSLYTINTPIRTAADMKGLTVRVLPGDLAATFIKALGATAVPLPYSRLGDALKTGAVDGASGNWPTYVDDGHYRYARVYNETMHSRAPGVVIVSRAAWRELSSEDRAILKQAALDSVPFMRERFAAYETKARAQALREGVRLVEDVDRKSFADILLPLYPGLLPGARQRNIVDRIQAEQQAVIP